ncbi:TIGR00730 family Rossman fold protein [Bryobacter aggregatus]|uniref:LOG family protein n=1 Tax=Bryobacter aggregatus TaxID=360054 RepID=UPI0004E2715B|nr:TIGR00730 family Rossman fold protein [Bryobacter aggregatus]
MKRICVFCGSSRGARPEYLSAATTFGECLAQQGLELVYGGARVGLMGAVADAVLAAGGNVIGVIPEALMVKEVAHGGIKDLRVVGSMHERKALMAELSDAFVAMPGGYGTLEELCEILTWTQLGLQRKYVSVLNTLGFFDRLLDLFDHLVAEGFLLPDHRNLLLVDKDPARLIRTLQTAKLPTLREKWVEELRKSELLD